MIIWKNRIDIGSRVELTEDVDMFDRIYTKGHQFTVTGSTERGWDLKDDNGHELCETRFISDLIRLIPPTVNKKPNP